MIRCDIACALPGACLRPCAAYLSASSRNRCLCSPHSTEDSNLFVDETCIDCDTCRWMQGDVFVHAGGKSAVARQPETEVSPFFFFRFSAPWVRRS